MKKIDFNSDWLFGKVGCEKYPVTLPHDASMYESRSPDSPGGSAHGFFPPGKYTYEKVLTVPKDWKDKNIVLEFGGVYKNSEVYINDVFAGGCAYGYSEFAIDTNGFFKYGQNNTIQVKVDNDDMPNCRWYTGAGIYRPVYMLIGETQHIHRRGVKITTLSINPAMIKVETQHTGGAVSVEILDGNEVVAKGEGSSLTLTIPHAKLWSDVTPNLYVCTVSLLDGTRQIEQMSEIFGIRSITWSNKGLYINGKETLLRGACVHSDHGILGAATFQKSEERRVKRLKKAGYNAIRASHNPASTFMLEACDKHGIYVMDETWDVWYTHKSKYDYAKDFNKNFRFDIKSMVERDYNHPSVIMYSVGNEISEPATVKGIQLTKDLVAAFHELDVTRPVTAGVNLMIIHRSAKGNPIFKEDGSGLNNNQKDLSHMSSTMFNMMTAIVGTGMNKAVNSKKADRVTKPCLDALDIAGYNYASGRYPLEKKANPNRVVVGSETFPSDIVKNWKMVEKFPYLIGDFMWTAWDYIGEAGIGSWAYTDDAKAFAKPYPWLLADVGAFDILGNPNGQAFLASTLWGFSKKPLLSVRPLNHKKKPIQSVWRGTNSIPSWSWNGCEGKVATVEVYSDAHFVELFLNGRKIAKKVVKKYMAMFKVKYEPGTLQSVAYDAFGNKVGEDMLSTAKGSFCVNMKPEEETVMAGDIVYVAISIAGKNGVVESNYDRKLRISVEDGTLLGFGSANPRTEETYTSGECTTYYGKAQAVVRSMDVDKIKITVEGKEVGSTSIMIQVTMKSIECEE
ncbi:MAG: DUF4982 domain-containing protein [Lachnospiraceae bacterium]|nr:DUF4982 domain-containing protein [Lachnospiraceae bacterium]